MVEVLYQGRKRKVHKGTRGGKYVVVKGEKRYLKSKASMRKKTTKKTSKKMKGGDTPYSLGSFTNGRNYVLVSSTIGRNVVKHKSENSITITMPLRIVSKAPGRTIAEKLQKAALSIGAGGQTSHVQNSTSASHNNASITLGREINSAIKSISRDRASKNTTSTRATTNTGTSRRHNSVSTPPTRQQLNNARDLVRASKNARIFGKNMGRRSLAARGNSVPLLNPKSVSGVGTGKPVYANGKDSASLRFVNSGNKKNAMRRVLTQKPSSYNSRL